MNLSCPSCDSTFRIEPDQIGPSGRKVKCGSCGHEWIQPQLSEDEASAEAEAPVEDTAPAEAEPPAPPAEVEPEAPPPGAEPASAEQPDGPSLAPSRRGAKPGPKPPAKSSNRRLILGWLFFFAVVGALAAGAHFGKAQIVAAFPAAAELYRLAGMPVVPLVGEGLDVRDVKYVRRLIDGQRVGVIEGTIVNISDQEREIPRLRASITDPDGAEVDQWDFAADANSLPPGGSTRFETSTRNAPRDGSLGIHFAPAE